MEYPYLVFDIETIPDQSPGAFDEFYQSITPPDSFFRIPDSLKSAAAILKREEENRENLEKWELGRAAEAEHKWRRTATQPAAGQIVCAAWTLGDDEPRCAWSEDWANEPAILRAMFEMMNEQVGVYYPTVVGQNLLAFDLPFVQTRCMIHRIQMPAWWPVVTKPYHDRVHDTMVIWRGGARTGEANMDSICERLGIPLKGSEFDDEVIDIGNGNTLRCDEISGKVVWDVIKAGRADIVAHYCKGDVDRTRRMHKVMIDILGLDGGRRRSEDTYVSNINRRATQAPDQHNDALSIMDEFPDDGDVFQGEQ